MSKKLIILLSLIGAIVVTILILFWTLFGLSSVSVMFHSTTKNLTLTEKEIVEQGKFRYGACVLFEGKYKSIKNLEDVSKNKNFSYLRVLNIETVFPNKFVIHVAEREELFKITFNGQAYVCDRDFRVLDVAGADDELLEVEGLEILQDEVNIGDFLKIKQISMKNFLSAMLQNNRDLSQILGKFKKINLSTYTEVEKEFDLIDLTTKEGGHFYVKNPDFALPEKLSLMFSVESLIFSQIGQDGFLTDKDGEILYFKENAMAGLEKCDGSEGEPLSVSDLKNYAICVDNLTINDFEKLSKNDIYWSLIKIN